MPVVTNCGHCGKEIMARKYRLQNNKKGVFCNRECWINAHRVTKEHHLARMLQHNRRRRKESREECNAAALRYKRIKKYGEYALAHELLISIEKEIRKMVPAAGDRDKMRGNNERENNRRRELRRCKTAN